MGVCHQLDFLNVSVPRDDCQEEALHFLEGIEGRHANAKAHEVVHHLTSSPSSRVEISQPGIEPPTSPLIWNLF